LSLRLGLALLAAVTGLDDAALTSALRAHLPGWTWPEPDGGLSLWVRLPGPADSGLADSGPADSGTFAQAALRHGVAVVPGRLLSATSQGCEHIRLNDPEIDRRLKSGPDLVSANFVIPYPPGFPIMVPGQGGTESPRVRADMVFLTTPGGGAVFSVGSINWLGSLGWNKYSNNVSRVTENVLRRFLNPNPF